MPLTDAGSGRREAPTDAQIVGAGALRAARIPIRTLAVAATGGGAGGVGTGGRRRAAGCALWQRDPADFGHPERIPRRTCATGVQTARRRPGEQRCGIHRPPPRKSWIRPPPPGSHHHPHAGGRGDGPRAARAGAGRRQRVIARRNRATGVQAARRHPGEVAVRGRSWIRALRNGGPPADRPAPIMDAARPPPRGRLASGRAASGCAKRVMALRPRGLRPSGSIARRNCATAVQAVRRRPGEVATRRR